MEEPGTGLSGGMNTFLRALLPALSREGAETDVLTRGTGDSVVVTRPFPRVRVFHLPCRFPLPASREGALAALPRFVAAARGLLATLPRHDALSAHYWMSGTASLALSRPLRLPAPLFCYHTVEELKGTASAGGEEGPRGDRPEGGGEADGAARRLAGERRRAEALLSREAGTVVFFTEGDRRRTAAALPRVLPRSAVVPPPLPGPFRPPTPAEREEARRRLGVPPGAVVFLLAARDEAGKGGDAARRAFRALREARGGKVLLLEAGGSRSGSAPPPGGGTDGEEGVGVVRLGPVRHDGMAALYAAVDAVLCPSPYESFGLVPLEALACAVPVAAPRTVHWGMKVGEEGGGIRMDDSSPAEILRAMETLLDEGERRRLSAEGPRLAAPYAPAAAAAAWLSLLRRSAGSGRSGRWR
jgi:glycosyltransferase involved in cell wall biosynthesis